MHYYYSLNRNYGVSNFGLTALPPIKEVAFTGLLSLPLIGGAAGYVYGGYSHKKRLDELNKRLAETVNPYEEVLLKEEINRLNKGNFLKRAGLVAGGVLAGGALRRAIAGPSLNWIMSDAMPAN